MKTKALLIITIIMMSVTACSGVNQADYDAVVKENKELKEQLAASEEKEDAPLNGERYLASIERDCYWLVRQIEGFETMFDGVESAKNARMSEAKQSIEQSANEHIKAIELAISLNDNDGLKKAYDNWVDTSEKVYESLSGIYSTTNEVLRVAQHY